MIIQIQLPKNKSARLQFPTLRIQWNLEKNSLVLVKSVISFHELEKKAFVSPLYPREQLQFEKNGSLGAIHCKIDRENDAAAGKGFWKGKNNLFPYDESTREQLL